MVASRKLVLSLLFPLLVLLACASTVPQQAVITLSPEVMFQTIGGWEATAQAGQLTFRDIFPKYKDTLYDLTVNDLGINRIRLEITNGVENTGDYFTQYLNGQISREEWKKHWYEIINDNNDPFVINPAGFHFGSLDYSVDTVILPIKQRLEARGEKLYVNLNYVDFGPSAFEHKNYPEEYAEFMLATFLHLRDKYGWTPDSIEIVLEADNAGWSGAQIGQAIAATGNRLKANGFHPAFIAPSTTNMANAVPLFDQAIQIPGAADYLTDLSYHRYGGVSDATLQTIGSRAIQYGIQTAHLELIGATYNDLHKDLTLGRDSSWAQFTIAWLKSSGIDDGGKYYVIDDSDPNRPIVNLGSRTRYLRQYFKYVRSGAVRILATSSDTAFEPLAFVNADCKQVVVVKAASGGSFSIHGLPSATYGVKYTTEAQYDIDSPDVTIAAGQPLQATIPAAGVITIYAKSVNCAPLVNISAASYRSSELASESLVASFGKNLAPATVVATATPLPTSLAGATVKVTDALGVERAAPLLFVSPQQINYQIPPGTSRGPAKVVVVNGANITAIRSATIARVVPGLFSANSSGVGAAAAVALRVKPDSSQSFEPTIKFDAAQGRYIPLPIDLGPDSGNATDQVFLILYGTGIRFNGGLPMVAAKIGDANGANAVDAPVLHALGLAEYVGLDQVTVRLPRSLAGRGEVSVFLSVDGKQANPVVINVK